MLEHLRLHDYLAEEDAFHLARVRITPKNPVARHGHADFAELFWVTAGAGVHLINGEQQPLQPGRLVFVRQTDVHGFRGSGAGLELTNLAFSAPQVQFVRRYLPQRGQPGEDWFWRSGRLPDAVRLDDHALGKLAALAETLDAHPNEPLFLHTFLLTLLRDVRLAAQQGDLPVWLAHACRETQRPEHLTAGVGAFYALAGRSPEHVARVTRKHLGCTPSAYVRRVRLAYAARQLRLSDAPILEVCFGSGFSSPSYFYRSFKRQYGVSPKRYRQRERRIVPAASET